MTETPLNNRTVKSLTAHRNNNTSMSPKLHKSVFGKLLELPKSLNSSQQQTSMALKYTLFFIAYISVVHERTQTILVSFDSYRPPLQHRMEQTAVGWLCIRPDCVECMILLYSVSLVARWHPSLSCCSEERHYHLVPSRGGTLFPLLFAAERPCDAGAPIVRCLLDSR